MSHDVSYYALLCMLFFYSATFVEVCAMDETTITCYNNTKIFIQSALYGRSNNFTCLSGQEVSSCNTLVDVSWRVLPVCQGKSSCVVSGSFDGLGSPCISSYFNISYDCKTRKLQGLFLCFNSRLEVESVAALSCHN